MALQRDVRVDEYINRIASLRSCMQPNLSRFGDNLEKDGRQRDFTEALPQKAWLSYAPVFMPQAFAAVPFKFAREESRLASQSHDSCQSRAPRDR